MHRATALALVAALWAAIYLPGLGSTELKGEEGRRILPAVTMLETGNWLVPYVGGKPYLRKPPLVNWAIAGMFKLTGVRNEWTARLPAALCVLALGLTIVLVAAPRGSVPPKWLDVETSLVAAIMAMTQFGLLAKAKFAGAEIEGIYAPLNGIAIVCWLAWHSQGRSPWLVWMVPGVFLGLACLTKGPSLHLLFFYAIVLAVLWREKALRQLWHPAPFAGLALCAGIFSVWAVPYFRTPEAATAAEVWKRQGLDRFTDSEFNAGNYFTNIPRALGDLLPWVLLVPAALAGLRRGVQGGPLDVGCWMLNVECSATPGSGEKHPTPNTQHPTSNGLRAVAVATLGCFLVVLLIPGTLPRYVLPLGAPIALVLALGVTTLSVRALANWRFLNTALSRLLLVGCFAGLWIGRSYSEGGAALFPIRLESPSGFAFLGLCAAAAASVWLGSRGRVARDSPGLTLCSGGLGGAAMIVFAICATPWMNARDSLRPAAREIDAAIPAGERLTLYNPGYLAPIFYLHTPYDYAPQTEDIPPAAPWVLARGGEREKLAKKRPNLRVVREIALKSGPPLLLLQRADGIQKVPAP